MSFFSFFSLTLFFSFLFFPTHQQKTIHSRWFLDRLATHILAFEGDSKVVWFEGGYSEYEADWRKRNGGALTPTRVKYRKMAALA